MRVECRRISIVVVDNGQPKPVLHGAAEVEATPTRMREVRGTPRGDDAFRARGPWRVETDGPDVLDRNANVRDDGCEGRGQRVDRRFGSFENAAGIFEQSIDEKLARRVENGGIVRIATVVETDDQPGSGEGLH